MFLHSCEHSIFNCSREDCHRLALVLHKAHFKIEARGFRKVPSSSRFFRAKYFSDRECPLKGADHDLLVELRRSGEKSIGFAEIFHLERSGTTFRIAADQSRRLEFDEALRLERFPICIKDRRLHVEDVPASL